jgi:hypothetical protein
VFPEENITFMVKLLSLNKKGASYTLKDVKEIFTKELGEA